MDEKLASYFEKHDYIVVAEAQKIGVSRAMLSFWTKNGELERVAHGVYALPGRMDDDLLLIAERSPNIIFSHDTALSLWQLHNRIPDKPTITIPQGCSVPHSIANSVEAHRIRPGLHRLGCTKIKTFLGHEVPCYDRERTVCDVIRAYSRMNIETYAGAIRNYAQSPEHNLPRLFAYARELGVESKVHRVIEVLI